MNTHIKRVTSYILSIAVGVGLLIGVMYYAGWRTVFAQIQALGLAGIVAVTADVLLAMAAWIASWYVILRAYGVRMSISSLIGARLSGYAISYVTPSLYFGGEPIRALIIRRNSFAPTTRIYASIIVERFLGGISMLIFVLVGTFSALSSVAKQQRGIVLFGIGFISFWIIIGFVNFARNRKWISQIIHLLGRVLPRWQNGFNRAADKVSETEDDVYDAFTQHWQGTLLAFALQVLATFFIYMRPQVFFYFSSQQTFSFSQLSLLFAFTMLLASFLWFTPGGLGTAEAALIGVFQLVAVGKVGAVAYSLTFKLVELLLVAVGITYLVNKGMSLFGASQSKKAIERQTE